MRDDNNKAVDVLLGAGKPKIVHQKKHHVRKRKHKIKPPTPTTKTGILIGITGNLGTVNVNGSTLTLPMLDHISTSIAVGTTVVVQVTGNAGVIIGSLGTTTRTTVGVPNNLTVPNPTPPRPVQNSIYYSTYFPTGASTWDGTQWYQAYSNAGNGTGGFGIAGLPQPREAILQDTSKTGLFVYGQGRFGDLSNKTIKSIEIYVPSAGTGSTTYKFYSHTYAAVPAGAPTISNGPSTVSAVNGWISMPSTMFASFLAGTAGLAISGAPANSIFTASPYGTIRIGWTR